MSITLAKRNPYDDRILRVAWYRGFAAGHAWADDHRPGTLAAAHPTPLPDAALETRDLSRFGGPVAAAWTRGAAAGKAHYGRRGFDLKSYREALDRGEGRGLAARPPAALRGCEVCGRPIGGRADRKTCDASCRKALSREVGQGQIGRANATAQSQIGVTDRRSDGNHPGGAA